jgi:hypothetical protein
MRLTRWLISLRTRGPVGFPRRGSHCTIRDQATPLSDICRAGGLYRNDRLQLARIPVLSGGSVQSLPESGCQARFAQRVVVWVFAHRSACDAAYRRQGIRG